MQGIVDLIRSGDRCPNVDGGSIAAADGGESDIKREGIRAAAAQPPFFSGEGIEYIFIIEGRIVFDAITAFVPGIEEGGCEQDVVAMVEEVARRSVPRLCWCQFLC